ncbi:MYCBP-associated protein-like [Rhodnius prolixus]|uniref:MYCBP-associated protein-like n=1 Tax=Rhodnius prolixus TaxID=13249 RepID=UPI003D18EABD
MEDLAIVFAKLDESVSVTKKDFCDYIEKNTKDVWCKPKSIENWTKWLKMRKLQYDHLGEAVDRSPDELVMNRETPWLVKHEKALLEEAQKISFYDKYRGHPNFWITTADACGKSNKEGSIMKYTYPGTIDFSGHKTSTIGYGYCGRPIDIMAEQSLTRDCRSIKELNKWKANPKVQKKKLDMKQELDKIEPFTPDIDNLVVHGKGSNETTDEKEKVVTMGPEIIVTMDETKDRKCPFWQYDDDPYKINEPVLKIGNTFLNPFKKSAGFLCYVSLYSDGIDKNDEKTIRIANKGSTVVHYKWKKMQCYKNNFPLKFSNCDQPRFFFDNSNGTILPGKNTNLFFLFKSETNGIYKEVWQLICRPSLRAEPIFFILCGVSTDEQEPIISAAYINHYLKKCKLNTTRTKCTKICEPKEPMKVYKFNELFNEGEKFEYNNPNLYYHRYEVKLLKSMYFKIKKQPWNYRMKSLHDAVNRVKNEKIKNKCLTALKIIYYSLQRPPIHRNISNSTYTGVYTLLCQCINDMEMVFVNLESVFSLQPLPRTELLYEKDETLLPEQVDANEIRQEKPEKVFNDIFKNYLKRKQIDTLQIGNISIPLENQTFKAGVLNTIKEEFGKITDVISLKVKHNRNAPSNSELKFRSKSMSSGRITTATKMDGAEKRTGSVKSEQERNLRVSSMENRKLKRKPSQIKGELKNSLKRKKFINYIKAHQKQKKIKIEPDSNRKRLRSIFIYQCKIILSKTIDEITAFLESTVMLDDVLDENNTLIGTHPKLAYSYEPE